MWLSFHLYRDFSNIPLNDFSNLLLRLGKLFPPVRTVASCIARNNSESSIPDTIGNDRDRVEKYEFELRHRTERVHHADT
jgi:hypothetical protein